MAYQSAFNSLKKIVTEAPILVYYRQDLKTIVKTNSSDYVSNRVLFQLEKDGLLHPITFYLKNLNPIKCNYKIYDKELLAIIRCFK